jgi:DNA-directed RNA polymerase specialized sigma24 family protein
LKQKDESPANARIACSELYQRIKSDLMIFCKRCTDKSKLIRKFYEAEDLLHDAWIKFIRFIKSFKFIDPYKSEAKDKKRVIEYFWKIIANKWSDIVTEYLKIKRKAKIEKPLSITEEDAINNNLEMVEPDVKITKDPKNKGTYIVKYWGSKDSIRLTSEVIVTSFNKLNSKKRDILWAYKDSFPSPTPLEEYNRMGNQYGVLNDSIKRARKRAKQELIKIILGDSIDNKLKYDNIKESNFHISINKK